MAGDPLIDGCCYWGGASHLGLGTNQQVFPPGLISHRGGVGAGGLGSRPGRSQSQTGRTKSTRRQWGRGSGAWGVVGGLA